MEAITRASWLLLALIHLAPAIVVFVPSFVERLYGVAPTGDVGVLLVHRGALFLAVLVLMVFATFDAETRRAASVVAAISMIGFLILFVRAGLPTGSLRTIAIVDAFGLLPLAFVAFAAWRG